MTKYLVYVHPAVAPVGINLDTWYSLDDLQKRFSLEELKCFFHPANFAWEELQETKQTKTK